MALMLAPYNDSMRLGMGFNSYTQTMCVDCAVDVSRQDEIRKDTPSQVVTYSSKFVEHLSDIVNSLNISHGAAIKKGTVEIAGNGDTINEEKIKASDINAVVSVKVVNQTTIVSEDAKFRAMQGVFPGTQKFNDTFGDCYISGFIQGGEFNGIISMRVLDRSKTDSVKSSIKTSLGSGGKGAEFTLDMDSLSSSSLGSDVLKNTETTITVSWMGGGQIKDPRVAWSVGSVYEAANAFPSLVSRCPQKTWAILTKYKANRSYVEQANLSAFSPLEYDLVATYTSTLFDNYMEYKQLIKLVQDIMTYPSKYEEQVKANRVPIDVNTLVAVRSAFRTEMSKIVQVVDILSKNPGVLKNSQQVSTETSNSTVASIIKAVIGNVSATQTYEFWNWDSQTDAAVTTNSSKQSDGTNSAAPEVGGPSAVQSSAESADQTSVVGANSSTPASSSTTTGTTTTQAATSEGSQGTWQWTWILAVSTSSAGDPAIGRSIAGWTSGLIFQGGEVLVRTAFPFGGQAPTSQGTVTSVYVDAPFQGSTDASLGGTWQWGYVAAPAASSGASAVKSSSSATSNARNTSTGSVSGEGSGTSNIVSASTSTGNAVGGGISTTNTTAGNSTMGTTATGIVASQQAPHSSAKSSSSSSSSTQDTPSESSSSNPNSNSRPAPGACGPIVNIGKQSQVQKLNLDLLIAPEIWSDLLPLSKDGSTLPPDAKASTMPLSMANGFPMAPSDDLRDIASRDRSGTGIQVEILAATCGTVECLDLVKSWIIGGTSIQFSAEDVNAFKKKQGLQDTYLAFIFRFQGQPQRVCNTSQLEATRKWNITSGSTEFPPVQPTNWDEETWCIVAILYGSKLYQDGTSTSAILTQIKANYNGGKGARYVLLNYLLLKDDPFPGIYKSAMIFYQSTPGGTVKCAVGDDSSFCILTDRLSPGGLFAKQSDLDSLKSQLNNAKASQATITAEKTTLQTQLAASKSEAAANKKLYDDMKTEFGNSWLYSQPTMNSAVTVDKDNNLDASWDGKLVQIVHAGTGRTVDVGQNNAYLWSGIYRNWQYQTAKLMRVNSNDPMSAWLIQYPQVNVFLQMRSNVPAGTARSLEPDTDTLQRWFISRSPTNPMVVIIRTSRWGDCFLQATNMSAGVESNLRGDPKPANLALCEFMLLGVVQ